MRILTLEELNDLGCPTWNTNIGTKNVSDYSLFLLVEYLKTSTKVKPLIQAIKDSNLDVTVFEIRMSTLGKDVLLGFNSEQELELIKNNKDIFVTR